MGIHFKTVKHTIIKRFYYYYRRRVPAILHSEYSTKVVQIALNTRCHKEARKMSQSITNKLDNLWAGMRLKIVDLPGQHLLLSYVDNEVAVPTLTEALELYLKIKGTDKGKVFYRTCERSIGKLKTFAGNKPIDRYTRADANGLRDLQLNNGLAPQSIKRMMSVINAVVNVSINEHSMTIPKVFSNIEYGSMKQVNRRLPIPINDIRKVQALCRSSDDDIRWLVALVSDTGCRLGEITGLLIEDLNINAEVPHVYVRPHQWRKLKTSGSERKVPLVGMSLWAAERIIQTSTGKFAFPRYTGLDKCNTNSASAGINKWLSNHVPENCVMHSFRHSLRDRLREVQCQADVIDQIGGWSTGGIGQSYGQGYSLEVLHEWMLKLEA